MSGRTILLAVCFVFSTPAVSYGQQTVNSENRFSCRVDSNDSERDLVDVLGTVSLNLGADDIAKAGMTCLLKIWPVADGALAEDLPNAFLALMGENPQVFFAVMSKNPAIFRRWLEELPEAFTWYEDPPCLLDPRRTQFISLLEHTKMESPQLESLKEQVIRKLSSIRCQQID